MKKKLSHNVKKLIEHRARTRKQPKLRGTVTSLDPTTITYKDDDVDLTVLVSHFDPLASELKIGQKVLFRITHPSQYSEQAEDLRITYTRAYPT